MKRTSWEKKFISLCMLLGSKWMDDNGCVDMTENEKQEEVEFWYFSCQHSSSLGNLLIFLFAVFPSPPYFSSFNFHFHVTGEEGNDEEESDFMVLCCAFSSLMFLSLYFLLLLVRCTMMMLLTFVDTLVVSSTNTRHTMGDVKVATRRNCRVLFLVSLWQTRAAAIYTQDNSNELVFLIYSQLSVHNVSLMFMQRQGETGKITSRTDEIWGNETQHTEL